MITRTYIRLLFDDGSLIEAGSQGALIHIAEYASIENSNNNIIENELFLPIEFIKRIIKTFDLA